MYLWGEKTSKSKLENISKGKNWRLFSKSAKQVYLIEIDGKDNRVHLIEF